MKRNCGSSDLRGQTKRLILRLVLYPQRFPTIRALLPTPNEDDRSRGLRQRTEQRSCRMNRIHAPLERPSRC